MPDRPLTMVLMGTGPFAVPAFEAIRRSGDSIALVVTRPEVISKSRKPAPPGPVRQWATDNGLPIFDPPTINADDAIAKLRSLQADLFVVCDYGQILSSQALEAAALGGINLHGSLLPAYRGAAPVQWAVWNGDAESGVSVIHMTPRLDGGPVIASATTPIQATETAGELEDRLSQLGVQPTLVAIDILRNWDRASVIGAPQDKSLVSKAPRLAKADGKIDWTQTVRQIDCHVRAMQPWPDAFTLVETGTKQPLRLVIRQIAASDHPRPADAQPGQVIAIDGRLLVAVGDGCIEILRLVPAGKREMSADAFVRGNPLPVGTIL
ncbi:Methionyl-tRNA formyltransferase [Rosistilla carotiformis]|uniref:Methionyl-tRNA formyltransferase n=1 Tax=Rosistilla carotiformis TaxID=2528017 RepID=A0A518JTK8_9BACT|nr:methionyl-tRNA formyltransferase [Rosistilla carotiformis]QDV68880.1 Methionyl-tRNA formyltransferase [Rosistilla carotiformis]